MTNHTLRIGIVATRLAGTDGVSLESAKWTDVLTEFGHTCYFFAGECDRPADRSRVMEEAHFDHPAILEMNADLFSERHRMAKTTEAVHDMRYRLKIGLRDFVHDFGIDLLVVENALSIPMNVPLGLALTELIAETNLPTIAHHHDFAWERERFAVNAAEDYLKTAFPPPIPEINHAVINSFAATQLAWRNGLRSTVVPNVMHFENPSDDDDDYSDSLRSDLGIAEDEALLLQPTRVVPRKRIQRAIELARNLDRPCSLVISHETGDEGDEYADYLRGYAEVMGVRVIFAGGNIGYDRETGPDGEKIYGLADAYRHADLVTYPSIVEGFGNAFLEAIYFRRPLMMSAYEIFKKDIQPKGFQVVTFGEFIRRDTVEHARAILDTPSRVEAMVEHNYRLGTRYYSYNALRERLEQLVRRSIEGTF